MMFLGVRELNAKLKEISAAMDPAQQTSLRKGVHSVLHEAVQVIKDRAVQNAENQNWPAEAVKSIFTFADPEKGSRRRSSALVGVGKRSTMVEWHAAKTPPTNPLKEVQRKVAPGGAVSMSLATMFETGTSKMPARPAFRPAVSQSMQQVADKVEDGIAAMIEAITKRPARSSSHGTGTAGGEFL